MSNSVRRHRRLASLATTLSAVCLAMLAATLPPVGTASAQSTRSTAVMSSAPGTAPRSTLGSGPDLQGLWDFTIRSGERTSPGFFALGPVERGWAGSITMYLTNTLAVRDFAVDGDSIRMVVASREGDVLFRARLSDNARSMEGIVEYHGGARLPMTARRRVQPDVPR